MSSQLPVTSASNFGRNQHYVHKHKHTETQKDTHRERHTHAQTLKIIVYKKYFKRPSTRVKSGILKLSALKDTLHASSSMEDDGGLLPTQPLDDSTGCSSMTLSLIFVCFLWKSVLLLCSLDHPQAPASDFYRLQITGVSHIWLHLTSV